MHSNLFDAFGNALITNSGIQMWKNFFPSERFLLVLTYYRTCSQYYTQETSDIFTPTETDLHISLTDNKRPVDRTKDKITFFTM